MFDSPNVLFKKCFQSVNWHSLFWKQLFVLGHYIPFAGGCVQIKRNVFQLYLHVTKFIQRKLKQFFIICFKMDFSILRQQAPIKFNISSMRQPPFGVLGFMPWVTEVDVYSAAFPGGYNLFKKVCIVTDKAYIGESGTRCFFHRQKRNVQIFFDCNKKPKIIVMTL